MIFWIMIILIVAGIGLYIYSSLRRFTCDFDFASILMMGIGIICAGFMAIAMICSYATINGTLAQYQERYKALSYKVECDAYRDEFGITNKEVIDEVQEWNETISNKKELQRNFWIGIFYPNIYDQFETIEYENFQ